MAGSGEQAESLGALLDVRPEDGGADRFAGAASGTDEKRTFGGVLLGQAVVAAARTAGGLQCHTFLALFVAGGMATDPAVCAVTRLRDGRSFISRAVNVRQGDQLLLSGLASFHGGDTGPEHQIVMPDARPPEGLEDQRSIRRRRAAARGVAARRYASEELLDSRPVDLHPDLSNGIEGRRYVWFRSRTGLPDDPVLHQGAIAFASDAGLVHVGTLPHAVLGAGTRLDFASLDHTIRFHRAARADQWLLHVQRAPVAAAGRGLASGTIFTIDGTLVATVTQEFLLRDAR